MSIDKDRNICAIPCKYEKEIKEACESIVATQENLKGVSQLSNNNIDNLREKIDDVKLLINSVIEDMKTHIAQGTKWRIAILGIIFAFLVNISGGIFIFGKLVESNRQHEKRIDYIISQITSSHTKLSLNEQEQLAKILMD